MLISFLQNFPNDLQSKKKQFFKHFDVIELFDIQSSLIYRKQMADALYNIQCFAKIGSFVRHRYRF